MEDDICVGISQAITSGSVGGGGLIFAIAYGFLFIINIGSMVDLLFLLYISRGLQSVLCERNIRGLEVVVGPALSIGSGGGVGLRSSPLVSEVSATILMISCLGVYWCMFHVDSVPQ